MNSATTNVNFSLVNSQKTVTFYVLLWRRNGIRLETFDDYWRDVHGPVCARLPGQQQYFQFHLAPSQGAFWPTIEGIEYNLLPEDQFEGIAELTFTNEANRQTWFNAAAILMDDEQNIFRKAIGYNTSLGNSTTYIDRINNQTPNGDLGLLKFHVLVKKSDVVSLEEFRQYMTNQFASNIIKYDSVLKFRLHLFDAVDNSRPDASGVVHYEPVENQYQAAFEIAFSNSLTMKQFFVSEEYTLAVNNQAQYTKQISIFSERTAYSFVSEGKMTLAGQRGSSVAQLITEVGAINQLKENITNLMSPQVTKNDNQQNNEYISLVSIN